MCITTKIYGFKFALDRELVTAEMKWQQRHKIVRINVLRHVMTRLY